MGGICTGLMVPVRYKQTKFIVQFGIEPASKEFFGGEVKYIGGDPAMMGLRVDFSVEEHKEIWQCAHDFLIQLGMTYKRI